MSDNKRDRPPPFLVGPAASLSRDAQSLEVSTGDTRDKAGQLRKYPTMERERHVKAGLLEKEDKERGKKASLLGMKMKTVTVRIRLSHREKLKAKKRDRTTMEKNHSAALQVPEKPSDLLEEGSTREHRCFSAPLPRN